MYPVPTTFSVLKWQQVHQSTFKKFCRIHIKKKPWLYIESNLGHFTLIGKSESTLYISFFLAWKINRLIFLFFYLTHTNKNIPSNPQTLSLVPWLLVAQLSWKVAHLWAILEEMARLVDDTEKVFFYNMFLLVIGNGINIWKLKMFYYYIPL